MFVFVSKVANSIKPRLRRQFRRQLADIDTATAQAAADAMAQHVLALPSVQHARGVLSCLSFGVEIDTWRLVDQLMEHGKQLYVPRVERGVPDLFIHPYPCDLETTSYDLRQPISNSTQLDSDDFQAKIDVVLVLGLAFDHQGYRLGYGGGYFDRFLARYDIPAIGLGYASQIVESLPREAHDVPMAELVTEKGCAFETR